MYRKIEGRAEAELRPLKQSELDVVTGGFLPVATPMSAHSVATDGAVGYLLFRLGWGQNG